MSRTLVAAYALACYALALAAALLLVGFVAGLPFGPGVDGGAVGPVGAAAAADLALVALFGAQHSVMARAGVKRRLARLVPPAAERSTYVLASSLAIVLLVRAWRPIPAVVWSVDAPAGALALRALFWGGAALVAASTFAISHAELLGLDRALAAWRGTRPAAAAFRTPALYRAVRHPMQAGFVVLFWATPLMTLGHLLLALAMTAYVLVGIRYEERDLVRAFGRAYEDYRRRVPRLVPRLVPRVRPRRRAPAAALAAGLAAALVGVGAAARRGGEPNPLAPGLHRDTLTAGGRVRAYRVYVPPAARGPRPVLVALHGASQDGALLRALAGRSLERLADSAGFLVVYADGWKGTWNDCRRAVRYAARAEGVDDVAFVRALAARLARDHDADATRTYALGFSNGAQMALRLALEAPDAVAGVAGIGAGLPTPGSSVCAPVGRPVRTALVSGTADPVNPHAGGEVRLPTGRPAGRVRSAEDGARWLAALHGAAPAPRREVLAARPRVERATWARPGAPGAVALFTIHGGGHAVPRRAPAAAWLGDPDAGADVVAEAVRFLMAR